MSLKVASVASAIEADDGYPQFEQLIRQRISSMPDPAFATDASGLFNLFLSHLPVERQQHYRCHCCKAWFERYAGLAGIVDGLVYPFLWAGRKADCPEFFQEAVDAVFQAIHRAKVTGVFISKLKTLGTPQAGGWSHLHGENPRPFKHPTKEAHEIAAEKHEEHGMLCRSLAEFPRAVAAEAVRVLEADALDRSEKTLGVAKWFHGLHESIEGAKGPRRDNLIWLAVAKAPPGWAHVRTSMIGTLLEDIQNGMDFDTVSRRWASKMHPLKYQRPTALAQGNLEQAEKAFAKMGAANSLKRRFARLADVVALWRPKPREEAKPAGGPVFGHLKPSSTVVPSKLELPAKTMTWEKFARDVLPGALSMDFFAPSHGNYFAMVTAADMTAPPIVQWDTEPRNPVTWYVYQGGSQAEYWGLSPGWVKVNAICLSPPAWHHPEQFKHHGFGAFLILEGAKDMRHTAGGGLFPECCRAEFHEYRKAIEAYTLKAPIEGRDEGDANGYAIQSCGNVRLRVASASGIAEYVIDRWE